MWADATASTSKLVHDEQRQVQVALNVRAMAVYLQKAFGAQSDGGKANPADCHILYVKYEPGRYCYVLYQLGTRLVTGLLQWMGSERDIPASARLIPELGMQLYRFEHDPALPGLRVATDGKAMGDMLAQSLPECRDGKSRVLRCCVTPVRYRPGLRCTLRLDVWLREMPSGKFTRRALFAKVYDNLAEMDSAYKTMMLLSDSVPAQQGQVVFARAITALPEIRVLVQKPVSGVPLDLYLTSMERDVTVGDPRGWTGVVRSASALAAVHTAGLITDRERSLAKELEHFVQRATQAARADRVAGEPLIKLAEALPAWCDSLVDWGAERKLIHGDCKPNQFLVEQETVAILDFDSCGMADPACDVGTYLATLRQLGIWQSQRAGDSAATQMRKAWLRALEDRFLEEYCAVADQGTDFRQRVTWYEAAALMRKAIRAFARSPHSQLTAAEVKEAWCCLETLPATSHRARKPSAW